MGRAMVVERGVGPFPHPRRPLVGPTGPRKSRGTDRPARGLRARLCRVWSPCVVLLGTPLSRFVVVQRGRHFGGWGGGWGRVLRMDTRRKCGRSRRLCASVCVWEERRATTNYSRIPLSPTSTHELQIHTHTPSHLFTAARRPIDTRSCRSPLSLQRGRSRRRRS